MEIDGEAYRINTDFRAGIAFSIAAQSGEPIQLSRLLQLYFPECVPADTSAAQDAIYHFFAGHEITPKENESPKPPPYAFAVDAEAITAEFQQVYQIDLTTVQLHWWRFLALLRGLITHSFSERVKFRTANPNEIKDKHTRAQWQQLKRTYALNPNGSPVQEPQTLEELNEFLLAQARGERR